MFLRRREKSTVSTRASGGSTKAIGAASARSSTVTGSPSLASPIKRSNTWDNSTVSPRPPAETMSTPWGAPGRWRRWRLRLAMASVRRFSLIPATPFASRFLGRGGAGSAAPARDAGIS